MTKYYVLVVDAGEHTNGPTLATGARKKDPNSLGDDHFIYDNINTFWELCDREMWSFITREVDSPPPKADVWGRKFWVVEVEV